MDQSILKQLKEGKILFLQRNKKIRSENEDYGNQVVICGVLILAAASNPIKVSVRLTGRLAT